MGTSTVHRSPSTGRWNFVDALYEDRSIAPRRILSEVLNAAAEFGPGLSDPVVVGRLVVLVDRHREVADSVDPAATASELVTEAQTRGRELGGASFYADLADRALRAVALRSNVDQGLLQDREAATRSFLSELLAFSVDHLVSRDATSHLGRGRLGTASDVVRLRQEVTEAARALASGPGSHDAIGQAAENPQSSWPRLVEATLAAGRSIGG